MNDIAKFIREVPKTELHLHIEGTLEPELMFNLAKRNNIKIPYSNIDEVKSVLIEIAKNNENVLGTPEPRVRFREFADHGLRLQLLFWIHKPEIRGRTIDAVNTEIYKQFAQRKISIPYPTMEVLLPDK